MSSALYASMSAGCHYWLLIHGIVFQALSASSSYLSLQFKQASDFQLSLTTQLKLFPLQQPLMHIVLYRQQSSLRWHWKFSSGWQVGVDGDLLHEMGELEVVFVLAAQFLLTINADIMIIHPPVIFIKNYKAKFLIELDFNIIC